MRLPDGPAHPILAPVWSRLNILQRVMLDWNDLHPYNAVHVVRIPEALNLERLRQAVDGTLAACGLTHLTLDRKRGAFRYHGGATTCEIKVWSRDDAPPEALSAEIERQLNTGFSPAGCLNPFRCFVEAGGTSFALGLVYFHPIADAEAIVRLLMRIAEAYAAHPEPKPSEPPDLCPPRHDRLLRQSPVLLGRKLAALPASFRALRRCSRPHCREAQNLRNGVALFSLDSDEFHRLTGAAKVLEVTLHDLFLALLMKALSPLAASRRRAARRRNLALGTIVNLRRDLGLDAARSFGLCLGSFIVTHPVPDEMPVAALAGDIRQQTLRIKRRKLYLGTPLEMALGRWALRWFSPERRKKLYPKHYPLWGGITNMNLNRTWDPSLVPGPADYWRAVSTGPVTPLVLSITTVRDVVNIGLTYRIAVFSAAEVEQVREGLRKAIQTLEVR